MAPLVTFILTCYNHESYVGLSIESVLRQDFSDFEFIIVDDCSTDRSWEVISSFDDVRLRPLRNEQNLGGSRTYRRGFELANGRYVSNLDSDDWFETAKTGLQVAALEKDPNLMVVGTWVNVVDIAGRRHAEAEALEALWNHTEDLNKAGTWCVRNPLCRSSTMIRRSFHMEHGLYELDLARAPDFELWTRALRLGAKMAVLPERLTNLRLHGPGVTHGDPARSLLEIAYLLHRNVLPLIDPPASSSLLKTVLEWHVHHNAFRSYPERQRWRLMALLLRFRSFEAFSDFRDWLVPTEWAEDEERAGALAISMILPSDRMLELERTAAELWRARDEWFVPRIEQLEAELSRSEKVGQELWQARTEWFLPRLGELEAELARCKAELMAARTQRSVAAVKPE